MAIAVPSVEAQLKMPVAGWELRRLANAQQQPSCEELAEALHQSAEQLGQ